MPNRTPPKKLINKENENAEKPTAEFSVLSSHNFGNFYSALFPVSPIHFFCFLIYFMLSALRHPHLGTPPHHYLAVAPSGRGGNLTSYRVPLLLMAVSVQSQVSVILKGSLWSLSSPSPDPFKPLYDLTCPES